MKNIVVIALAACGAFGMTAAHAADSIDGSALSALYVEKCPESMQVIVDYLTENNTKLEGTDQLAAEAAAVTESGCGTDADRVYVDMMKPETIQAYNDLLAKGPEELQKKLDSDVKQLAEEILMINPIMEKAKAGAVSADDLTRFVLFGFAQNRKKSIEEIVAE